MAHPDPSIPTTTTTASAEPTPSQPAAQPPSLPVADDKKPLGAFSKQTALMAFAVLAVTAAILIPALSTSRPTVKVTKEQQERITTATAVKTTAIHTETQDPAKKLNGVLSESPQQPVYPTMTSNQPSGTAGGQNTSANRPGTMSNTSTGAQDTPSPRELAETASHLKEMESLNSAILVYTRDSTPKSSASAPSNLQPASTSAQQASHQPPPFASNSQPSDPPRSSPPPPPTPGRGPSPLQNALNASTGPSHRLFEGTYIDTVLTTRINGTFAGPVNCMVTTDVWSHNRQHVLIPQGAHVLGEARRVDTTGQQRLAVVFHRIIMPDGYSVSLDQFTGLNQIGESGLKDKVDNHYVRIFGTSLALGAIAGLSSLSSSSNGNNSGGNFSQGFSQTISQEAMQILNKYLNILPTVIIREGVRVKVYLTGDLSLPAYGDHRMPNDI